MQRILGLIVGGITIYVLLLLMDTFGTDTQPKYLLAIVIGLIAAWAWPVVIGFWLARRAKARRDDKIEDEVQRQLAEERAKSNQG